MSLIHCSSLLCLIFLHNKLLESSPKRLYKTKRETCTSDFNEFSDKTKRGDFWREEKFPGRARHERSPAQACVSVETSFSFAAAFMHVARSTITFSMSRFQRKWNAKERTQEVNIQYLSTHTDTQRCSFLWFLRNMWTGIRTRKKRTIDSISPFCVSDFFVLSKKS